MDIYWGSSWESKLSKEGRVSIPTHLRQSLDLHEGDKVRFVLDEAGVHLVNPRQLIHQIWANNTSSDEIDVTQAVRDLRQADLEIAAQAHADEAEWYEHDQRSPEEVTDALFEALGIPQ